jgi:hypothetical protein
MQSGLLPKTSLPTIVVAFTLIAATVYAGNDDLPSEPPLHVVERSTGCRNFERADDATLEPFIRWLAGYRDGVAALAVFDKRLGDVNINLLAALVLSSCHPKPDRYIGEVANEILEVLISHKPGRRLNLGYQNNDRRRVG